MACVSQQISGTSRRWPRVEAARSCELQRMNRRTRYRNRMGNSTWLQAPTWQRGPDALDVRLTCVACGAETQGERSLRAASWESMCEGQSIGSTAQREGAQSAMPPSVCTKPWVRVPRCAARPCPSHAAQNESVVCMSPCGSRGYISVGVLAEATATVQMASKMAAYLSVIPWGGQCSSCGYDKGEVDLSHIHKCFYRYVRLGVCVNCCEQVKLRFF